MNGRTVLVTGASSGIGRAIARRLAAAGARVHGISRRGLPIDVEPGWKGEVVSHAIDVTDTAALTTLIEGFAANDPLDTVVLAAGTNIPKRRFSELTDESFDEILKTNLYGVFTVLRLALPQLREKAGDVVVISSISANWPDHSGAAYGASKSAVLNLARGLSRDEHGHGVRVCTILPGIVDTPILDKRPSPPPAEVRELAVHPDDIAEATLTAVTLPNRTNIAEMSVVSTRLQFLGGTQDATPALPLEMTGEKS
jgi:NAD(P)-dependent dehydrogenase (short-subunit alcohol dehydrogenase family)